ncbi:Radical SAM domain protein [Caldalkalibacillus thermarum TA2.A1]|uniref:Radical SAM domain protein n=1 Tax=Caldalkalibacillus thermarum (strain TA2.A1) TaxID=986075 RepID=F5L5J0_CALTT|nr:radical SAM protein [Caldalkalibacillus thermarum]EGL83388.1 Radical SAM domain protein [Caldalkalibacillus thermarum TA2.A1]QZT34539.1 radical SAM protein [Caldalkalibacillus thermarum TA2.A1]
MASNKLQITYRKPGRLLNPASGYLTGYTHTLNPYAGCAFACTYCYVRRLPVALFHQKEWGTWVDVKENAPHLLEKELRRAKQKGKVTIFMSSSTDPYQPLEVQTQLSRSLLEVMAKNKPDFLFVQTRSPLITRDIDLLLELKDRLCVSITIETDLEQVRKTLSPAAPPLAARMKTLARLKQAGLPAQAAISPLLPFSEQFPQLLKEVVDWVCLDDFFRGDGAQGKRTEKLGIKSLYQQLGYEDWYTPDKFTEVCALFQKVFDEHRVLISQQGFMPFGIG